MKLLFKWHWVALIVLIAIWITLPVNAAAPVASFTSNVTSGTVPASVQFNDTTGSNLLTYSQQFDNAAWWNYKSSITSSVIPTANQFPQNLANGNENGTYSEWTGSATFSSTPGHFWQGATSIKVVAASGQYIGTALPRFPVNASTTYTLSFYGLSNMSENLDCYINERTAAGTNIQDDEQFIAVNGSDWTRGTITITTTPTTGQISLKVYPATNSTTYLDGLQLEQNSVATTWVPGTFLNGTLAPDGAATATKLVEDSVDGSPSDNDHHNAYNGEPAANNSWYTFSAYLKKSERTWAVLGVHGRDNTWRNAYFDLNSGTVGMFTHNDGTLSSSISPAGNGWYRCSLTFYSNTYDVATSYPYLYIMTAIGNGNSLYIGDGASGIFMWGAQLENGTILTPYKVTTNTINHPTSWLWSFGDGTTSTSQDPVHSYSTSGHYTVSLTSSNSDGSNTSTGIGYITANVNPLTPLANSCPTAAIGSGIALLGVALIVLAAVMVVAAVSGVASAAGGRIGSGGSNFNLLLAGVAVFMIGAILVTLALVIIYPLLSATGC